MFHSTIKTQSTFIDGSRRGFTLVELLIVIVVIAILAAITVISYNGITAKAHASVTASAASDWAQILQLYAQENGSYPTIGSNYGVCLGENFPAEGVFDTGVCGYDASTDSAIFSSYPALMTELKTVSNLPNGVLPTTTYGNQSIRGIMYSVQSNGTSPGLFWFTSGNQPCGQGTKTVNGNQTGCEIDLE